MAEGEREKKWFRKWVFTITNTMSKPLHEVGFPGRGRVGGNYGSELMQKGGASSSRDH